MNFTLVV